MFAPTAGSSKHGANLHWYRRLAILLLQDILVTFNGWQIQHSSHSSVICVASTSVSQSCVSKPEASLHDTLNTLCFMNVNKSTTGPAGVSWTVNFPWPIPNKEGLNTGSASKLETNEEIDVFSSRWQMQSSLVPTATNMLLVNSSRRKGATQSVICNK